jgi:uncharacterized protein
VDRIHVAVGRLGRGVFASRNLDAREVVEICPTIEVDDDDVGGNLADYVFDSPDGTGTVLFLGYGMLYNHAYSPNLTYRTHGRDAVAFVTTRPVKAGEELTIDYGREWWDGRGLTPD